jgi:hypothetical protein
MGDQEDPFEEFRKSSPHHRAETRPSGTLILSAKQSLLNFQPVARRALDIAAENNRTFKEHTVRGRRGEEFYDQITIFP